MQYLNEAPRKEYVRAWKMASIHRTQVGEKYGADSPEREAAALNVFRLAQALRDYDRRHRSKSQ